MDCIPGGDVQTSLLKTTSPRIDTIPSRNALLSFGRVPSDEPMEPSSEIAKGIVTDAAERPRITLERVLTTAIKRLPTHTTVLVPVVTDGPLRADR